MNNEVSFGQGSKFQARLPELLVIRQANTKLKVLPELLIAKAQLAASRVEFFIVSQILVLDDEENYALMLCALLTEYGFAVDVATSSNDACQMIRDKQYALIVSDYRMPLMDGAAFLKKVRMIHPRLPVFLVSGAMDTAELVKVANLGATRVYEKPLDTEMFLGQVAAS